MLGRLVGRQTEGIVSKASGPVKGLMVKPTLTFLVMLLFCNRTFTIELLLSCRCLFNDGWYSVTCHDICFVTSSS